MAKYGSNNVTFIVGGFDVSGVSTNLSDVSTANLEETTGLGDAWQEQTSTGVRTAELTADGFYDDATDSINAALGGSEASSKVVSYYYAGGTLGTPFTSHEGVFAGTYTRQATRGELTKANGVYTVTGVKDEGVVLLPLATVSATGTGSATNYGSATSSGGAGTLQVTAVDGTSPTADVKIRHSADDITYADLITFTQATARTAERTTVSGTVNQYLKATYTIGGTAPNVTLVVGFARG